MIDTVRLGYDCYTFDNEVLEKFWRHDTTSPILPPNGWKGEWVTQKTWHSQVFDLPGGRSVQATYYPNDRHGKSGPYFILEFSIPKFLYGTNVCMIQDLEDAIRKVNNLVKPLVQYGLPLIDISKGALIRVDLCYNHQVGDYVRDYLSVLSKLSYPHREDTKYKNATVVYASNQRSTTFYDKQREMHGDPQARGILRQEQRLNEYGLIKKITRSDHPTLLDFYPGLVKQCLEMDLEKLGLNNDKVRSYNEAFNKLLAYSREEADKAAEERAAKKGVKPVSEAVAKAAAAKRNSRAVGTAYRLYGFLLRSQGKTRNEMQTEGDRSKRMVDRDYAAIQNAGVSLVLSDNDRPLPKLEINFEKSLALEQNGEVQG